MEDDEWVRYTRAEPVYRSTDDIREKEVLWPRVAFPRDAKMYSGL